MTEYVPGLAGIPAAQSSISFIDGEAGILEYRGIRIEALAEQSTYEEVADLLLRGALPNADELTAFSEALGRARRIPDALRKLILSFPADAHPMDALQTAAAALAMFHERADTSRPKVREKMVVDIIAKIPTMVAAFHRARRGLEPIDPDPSLGHAADFLRMITGTPPDDLSAHIMDVCLILHADHTMNASTFTARVTASTEATPFGVVAAAIGSLSGPLHGGANERVLIQLREIGSRERVRETVTRMVENREKIMGLGHRVYKTKDPRATALQGLTTRLFEEKGPSEVYGIAVELEKVAKEKLAAKGVYPNVDFYSGIVYDKLGIPSDLFTPIFAVSRTAGWLAHWLEQMEDNRIFRPRQIYEGRRNERYIPIAERR